MKGHVILNRTFYFTQKRDANTLIYCDFWCIASFDFSLEMKSIGAKWQQVGMLKIKGRIKIIVGYKNSLIIVEFVNY